MPFQYETRHVQHGNDYGIFVPINNDCDNNTMTYGNAYEYTGLINTSFETTQESTQYYADNVEHISLRGIETTSGSLTVYQIRKEFMTGPLGKTLLPSGAYIDTGTPVNFVWIFKETVTNSCGAEYPLWHIYTNCQASAPTGATTTDNTTATPKEITIPITCSPNNSVLDPNNGKAITVIDIPDKDGAFKEKIDNLFTSSGSAPGTETMQSIFDYILSGSDDTTPTLSAPVITTASDGSSAPVLTWTAVTGATEYKIYRNTSGVTPLVQVDTVQAPTTSWTDPNPVADTTYDYQVCACTDTEDSNMSNLLTIPYMVAIAAPTDAPTVTDGQGTVNPVINWTSVTGASSYNVYRANSGDTPTILASNQTGLTYTDTSAIAGTAYDYTVSAVNSIGEGPQSSAVTISAPVPATPTDAPTASDGAGTINPIINWTSVDGATSYNVYRAASGGTLALLIGNQTGNSYTDTTATPGTAYDYAVSAVNAGGEGPQSSVVTITAPSLPDMPTNVTATPGATAGSGIDLSWDAVSNATGYNVYRAESGSTPATPAIATAVSGTTYTDSTVTSGTSYVYTVSAINNVGEGSQSAETTAVAAP